MRRAAAPVGVVRRHLTTMMMADQKNELVMERPRQRSRHDCPAHHLSLEHRHNNILLNQKL
jgi:hypothetical protein